MSLKKVLFICLTLSLMDAVVMAGDGEKKCKSGRLEAKDTNQDGSLSLDEILAGCPEEKAEKKKQWFAKLDANNDGLVSKEEMKGHCKERKEKKEKKED